MFLSWVFLPCHVILPCGSLVLVSCSDWLSCSFVLFSLVIVLSCGYFIIIKTMTNKVNLQYLKDIINFNIIC